MDPRTDPPPASDFFEMSLDHLCIVAFDGHFLRVNPAWTRTLGWSHEELLASPSIDLVHPDDRDHTLAGRLRLHGGADLGPLRNRYRHKDGTYRWFEWRSIAEVSRGVVYAAAREITEQMLAEERLREAKEQQEKLQLQLLVADRMASVGTLAAGSAHEINNPLVSVTANLSMILEELSSLETVIPGDRLADLTRMATEARTAAERIRRIVRDLKTFARAAEDRPSAVNVEQVIALAISLTAAELEQRARLVTEYGVTPAIRADVARFGQVLIHLLVNAAQSIPEGASSSNEIRIVTGTDEEGRAVIEVRDTGSGIDPAILGRIFDPFFTTRPVGGGTGLGLSVCHNVVVAMGGQLTVSSEVGSGSTFRIVVPAAPPATEPVLNASPDAPAAATRGTVLVVDDDPMVGSVLLRVLKQHDVTFTTQATQALAFLDAGRRFDVILSDLMMPEMSGMELHDTIAAQFPDALDRMVFISGGAFTAGASSFLDRVPNIRIEKPFDAKTLRAIVQRFIDPATRAER